MGEILEDIILRFGVMSAKKNTKHQPLKTPPKLDTATAPTVSALDPGSFWERLAPNEQADDVAVRSWRNIVAWGVAVAAFLVPWLVTFNFDTMAFGNVIMGKECILRFSALLWLIFVSVSLAYGYRVTPTRRALPLIALAAVYLAWIPFYKYTSYTVPKSVVIATGAALFFAMTSLDLKGKTLAARATVLGGFLSVIITSVMSLAPSTFLKVSRESRFALTDTFGNENFYALFLLAMIPLTVFVIGSLWARGRRKWAWVCAVFLLATIIQFAFTYSRSGYVGAVAAFIAWLAPFSLRKTIKVGAAFIIVTCVVVGASFALVDRYPLFYMKLVDAPRALQQRMEIWNIGLGVFAENPVLGAGPGSLQVKSLGKKSPELLRRSLGNRLVDAHNDIITVAMETGFGVIFYLLFMGILLYDGSKRRDAFGKLAFAGFVGIFATCLSISSSVQVSTLFFPLLLGAIMSGKDDYIVVSKGAPTQPYAAFGYAGAAICLFLAWWTFADLREAAQFATFEKATQVEGAVVAQLKPQLRNINDVYPPNPARYKHEAWVSLKELDLPRYLEMSRELYQRDPAELSASFNYGYALLLNGSPREAEPLLLDSWKQVGKKNGLLPALLYVAYHELEDDKQAEVFMEKAHSGEEFVQPEVVLAKLRQMKIVKR